MIDSPAPDPIQPDATPPEAPPPAPAEPAVAEKPATPVAGAERIAVLDVLRGFAVLGILVMNISSFASLFEAYMNPTLYGDFTGLNELIFYANYLFANQKFMTLFSILFGAGVVLMTGRAAARTGRSAALHYRRMLWLILIGMLHAYVLWYGDILVLYGTCGLWIYLLRKLRPRWLVTIGVILLLIPMAVSAGFGAMVPSWPDDVVAEIRMGWEPDAETMRDQLEAYRGDWLGQLPHRTLVSFQIQTTYTLLFGLWRAGGLMLLGMALFKLGVLSGERSKRFFVWLAVLGLGLGFPLVVYGLYRHIEGGWSFPYSMFFGELYNYVGSVPVCLGYIALIMLAGRSPWVQKAARPLAAVGRMALSNYLLQTLICTTIFYGHGLGLFGRVDRVGQLGILLAVCAVQLIVSPLWLHAFRFGPAEWLWRTLTYGRLQPMRRRAAAELPAAA